MKITGIKFGILIWVAILFQPIYAADYYFSSTVGQDTRSTTQAQNPSTPWKSIQKLNEVLTSLKPGDNVFLRRGDTFYGTINLAASGTAANRIKIGAYGTGNNPIVTSFQPVNQWRSTGKGRFESSITFNVNNPSVVAINGVIQEQGRFPNKGTKNEGYLIIDNVQGSNSISTLDPVSGINYNGGEVVVRKVPWVTDRHYITNQTGATFVLGNLVNTNSTGNYNASPGWGFFVQNHIETLDVYGEWFFNNQNKRLYMHFGSSNTSNVIVEVATLDHLLTKTFRASFITVENISFTGANKDAVYLDGGNGITLSNIEVSNVGETAIHSIAIKDIEIKDSKISNALANGIALRTGNERAKITNNLVENIGMFQGGMPSGEQSGIGIMTNDSGADILNNKVLNTAYNGIHFRRNDILIKNNYINGYCIHKTDGGGVYSFGGASGTEVFQNRVISHNIILNGRGTNIGTPKHNGNASSGSNPLANGIFLDDNVTHVDINNNTIAHATNAGITLSNTDQIKIENNTIFDNGIQIAVGNYTRGRDVRNVTIRNNTLVTKDATQRSYNFVSHKDDLNSFGTFDQNTFSNPLGDDQKIHLNYRKNSQQITEVMDLNRWKSSFNKDRASTQSPYKVEAFEYIKSIGAQLYAHGSFEGNLVGLACSDCQVSKASGKIQGSSLQVVSPATSTSRISIGAVTKDKNYILKFKSRANQTGPLRVFLRYGGSPWQSITTAVTVEVSTDIQEHTILLQPTVTVANPVIMLVSDIGKWTYWVDDLQISEAEIKITDPNDVFLFEVNNTNSKKSISLSKKYIDVKGNPISGNIEINSQSSALLVKSNDQLEEKPDTPPSISLMSLSDDSQLVEGDEINFIVEAVSEDNNITNIEILMGDKVYSSAINSPSYFKIDGLKVGSHKVWARASCDKGMVTNSDTLSFNVKQAPAIIPIEVGTPNTAALKKFFNMGSVQDVTSKNQVHLGESKSGVKFSQSNTFTNTSASPDPLFQTERHGSNINISVPVPNGEYQVITYHNELWFGKGGPSAQPRRRVFDISIENSMVLPNFDIFVHNSNKPTTLIFDGIIIKDNMLNINLQASINNATISGIAVISTKQEQLFELHLNTGDSDSVENEGIEFVGDTDKGNLYSKSNTFKHVTSNVNPLFHSERHAQNLKYSISVPNGTYRVITYHNELWFGKAGPSSQPNRRVFDITIEGKKVKENFDIFVTSKNQPTKLEFENIQVQDGTLNIDMLAKINNVSISGVSIVSQSLQNTIEIPKESFSLLLNTGADKNVTLNDFTFLGEKNTEIQISGTSGKGQSTQSGVNELMHTERWGKNISYNIPVPNGVYTVFTFHNELRFPKSGPSAEPNKRVFDITIEGNMVKQKVDLFKENNNRPTMFTFNNVTVTDGELNLNLIAHINNATISGIAIFGESGYQMVGAESLRRGYREMEAVSFGLIDNSESMKSDNSKVYPNPAKDWVNIEVNQETTPQAILIYDTSGRLVNHVNQLQGRTDNTYSIKLDQIPQGVYVVHVVNTDQTRIQHRLIVNP